MKRSILALFTLLLISSTVSAQTRRTRPAEAAPTIPVTVVLKDGQKIKGEFVSASEKSATVRIASSAQVIPVSDIAELVFSEEVQKKTQAADSANAAARNALVALQTLDSATSVGLNFAEYGRRLIDAKVIVDQSVKGIPDSELKNKIEHAMMEYSFAAQVWQAFNSTRDGLIYPSQELGKLIIERYKITPYESPYDHSKMLMKDAALSAIWQSASDSTKKATEILNTSK